MQEKLLRHCEIRLGLISPALREMNKALDQQSLGGFLQPRTRRRSRGGESNIGLYGETVAMKSMIAYGVEQNLSSCPTAKDA